VDSLSVSTSCDVSVKAEWSGIRKEHWPLLLGLWAVPVSIAVSEFLLGVAALLEIIRLARRQTTLRMPRCGWFWLIWAAMEIGLWRLSADPDAGSSEIRHLLLLGFLFVALSSFDRAQQWIAAWKGVFVTATVSSAFLILQFFLRLHTYRDQIAGGGDSSFYLRAGGLLHHWMVYGTVEILVVAGLIGFWSAYPNQRRRLLPLIAINGVAIVLSLTRMTWLACLLLLTLGLIRMHSKWVWALPAFPIVLYFLAPEAVRTRAANFTDPGYYSNAERLQMIEVGWKMVRDHPLTGVGPGRVEQLYVSYLKPGDPVPAYHGHLHNNFAQTAAQFGIPAGVAALLFIVCALLDLLRASREAPDPDRRFLSDTALLAFTGFLFAGLFEYTYGHSLGLIMIAFALLPSLLLSLPRNSELSRTPPAR
jgi:O-antigen ligase